MFLNLLYNNLLRREFMFMRAIMSLSKYFLRRDLMILLRHLQRRLIYLLYRLKWNPSHLFH